MTPEQFQEKLKASIPQFAAAINNAPFVSILDAEGAVKQRIFNKGKASDESKIGDYDDTKKQTFLTGLAKPSLTKKAQAKIKKTGESLTYKELRKAAGLQVEYVDLQFFGNLKNSIITGRDGEQATLNFNNEKELKIANYLTVKYKKPIFTPSENELVEAKEKMLNYIREEAQKIIQQWR